VVNTAIENASPTDAENTNPIALSSADYSNPHETAHSPPISPTSNSTHQPAPASPTNPSNSSLPTYTKPTSRSLPERTITEANIAQRYIEFIFYCNPSAPLETDMTSLLRAFFAVPKSDGKQFSPWHLYQLVAKHESGEIKTWTKLAQQLGVERNEESSPQKIQQYAVRLKKWMRSIHLDAFFDYVLSKPNDYYAHPSQNPTGYEDPEDNELDDSDLVLKLIKRANSKRKKRRYVRRNTLPGTTPNSQLSPPPSKRQKVTFSAGEEDDLSDVADQVDNTGVRIVRRKSLVQVGVGPRWPGVPAPGRDILQLGNGRGGPSTSNVNGGQRYVHVRSVENLHTGPSLNLSSQRPRAQNPTAPHLTPPLQHPSIPTPTPSPTALPDTRHDNYKQHPTNRSSASGTQIRWRNTSKRRKTLDFGGGHYDIFRLKTTAQPTPQQSRKNSSNDCWPDESRNANQNTNNNVNISNMAGHTLSNINSMTMGPSNPLNPLSAMSPLPQISYSELLLPPASGDAKELVIVFQERLVRAVTLLEDRQKRIDMLENVVRQREDEVRRVVRRMKDEFVELLKRWE
ncbi:10651_t:CDS:2, partial [Paraglomus occultum]